MKYLLLVAGVFTLWFTGCVKDEVGCTNVNPSAEEPQILAYAAASGITPTKHVSGLYYQIIDSGMGVTPNINSVVTVNYTGKFLNGTQFDKSVTDVKFPLSGVIEGWIIGIPLIKKGGKIKLIVPSALAYGCTNVQTIPSNSILYFEVDLKDVQ
jgi:FKBP-type peptidyl-prolyl cis-trans isomerase FkpA